MTRATLVLAGGERHDLPLPRVSARRKALEVACHECGSTHAREGLCDDCLQEATHATRA